MTICKYIGCNRYAAYNIVGMKNYFCSEHKQPNMVDVKNPTCPI